MYRALAAVLPHLQSLRYPALHRVLARNVLNVDYIDSTLEKLLVREEIDPTSPLGLWVKRNLRNWLLENAISTYRYNKNSSPESIRDARQMAPWAEKALDRGEELHRVEISRQQADQIQHVLDYLRSPDAPKDLTRVSVPDAIKSADDWNRKAMKAKDEAAVTAGTVEVKKYPDGYRWVKLMNGEALKRESEEMRHCVGKGGYTAPVQSGEVEIFSLRDPDNKPHATIEWRPARKTLNQIKGEYQPSRSDPENWISNGPVLPQYHRYVQDFIQDLPAETKRELANAGMYELPVSGGGTKVYTHDEIAPNAALQILLGEYYPEDLWDQFGKVVMAEPKNRKKKHLFTLQDFKTKPKALKFLLERDLSEVASKNFSVEGDEVWIFGEHIVDFRDHLEALGIKSQFPPEDEASDFIEVHMAHEFPEHLIDALEKKHPKTYRHIMKLLEKLAAETDEGKPEGRWFYDHQDDLPEGLWEALQYSIEQGYRDGTYSNYISALQSAYLKATDNSAWGDDSTSVRVEEENDKYYLVVPIKRFLEGIKSGDLDLRLDIDDKRWSYDSDYDHTSAQETFYSEYLPDKLKKD